MLEVVFPPARTHDATCVIEGSSAPGGRVHVASVPVATEPGGRFRTVVALQPGPNLIVVEAADSTGNTSYRSKIITALRGGLDEAALSGDPSKLANRLSLPALRVPE